MQQGVAMGSPISNRVAEIFLQHYEQILTEHWMKDSTIIYYSRYVDNIFVIFDTRLTTEETILNNMNKIHKNMEFKMTIEKNKEH
jgi:hypothetical protein